MCYIHYCDEYHNNDIFKASLSKLKDIKVGHNYFIQQSFFLFFFFLMQTLTEISCAISVFGWNFQNKYHA